MGTDSDDVLRKEFKALSNEKDIEEWVKLHPEEFDRFSEEMFERVNMEINEFLEKYEGTPYYLDIIDAIQFGYNLKEREL